MSSAVTGLSDRFNRIWDNIWSRFFCEKTHLFYDYLADGKELTGELPTPEEIALQIPNPCGWGTGMEDSMLNAGNMLQACLTRYDRERDDRFRLQARKVFAGMAACASIGKTKGFVARIHPYTRPAPGPEYHGYETGSGNFQPLRPHFAGRCLLRLTELNDQP